LKKLYTVLIIIALLALTPLTLASISSNSTVIVNEPATFSISLTGFEGVTLAYNWTFGDGSFSYTESSTVQHTYTAKGTYNVEVAVYSTADFGDDWTVSPEWMSEEGYYTTTITVLASLAEQQANKVITNMWMVMGLISTVLIIIFASLILASLRNGEVDEGAFFAGIILVISIALVLVIGIAIINSLETAFVF
jgi:hypothetical protein